MKIIATTLLAASTALFASSGTAKAGDAYSFGRGGYNGYSFSHNRTHDSLDHNEYHRQSRHNAAHRYPMSYRQHGGLHDQLNHDRYHDGVRHQRSHRPFPTYGNSFYGGSHRYTTW